MPKWIADRRLYLSEGGQVVGENAPGRKTLLAPQGKELPDEVCRQYCLGPYGEPVEMLAAEVDPDTQGQQQPEGDGAVAEATNPEAKCRHSWRKDDTCRCGAVRPDTSGEFHQPAPEADGLLGKEEEPENETQEGQGEG